jgi:hypothetical protein
MQEKNAVLCRDAATTKRSGARVCGPQQFGLQAQRHLFIFFNAMLLHRYLGSHAFETLKEAKLKTSRLTDFNDPFEFLFITKGKVTAKIAREYISFRSNSPDFLQLAAQQIQGLLMAKDPTKVLKKNIPRLTANLVKNSENIIQLPLRLREQMADKNSRIICFSDSKINPLDEILLWSHYAKMHGGVRIGFEFPDGIKYPFKVFKVDYREKRFEIDVSEGLSNLTIGQALVESAKVKSLAWRYENEYRLLTHPDCCEQRTMPDSRQECFLVFDRGWVKSIDFGVRCSQAEIERILNLLKSDYPKEIRCRKAVFHKTEYALEYDKV